MSAAEVGEAAVRAIVEGRHHLLVVNFANADMVGHTGVFEAAVKAIEVVDRQLGLIAKAALKQGWRVIICGDHGNAEMMIDENGGRYTAHTINPVPCILLGCGPGAVAAGWLPGGYCPTILELAGCRSRHR